MRNGGAGLLLEGFLKKRKDTMKMKWVTYWFRLQNTTLFFYTKKEGNASHLRGVYYIYTMQSVREVPGDAKRFVFEITMTNGRRKLLAAETAALRSAWIRQLWEAMDLSKRQGSDGRSTARAQTECSACSGRDVSEGRGSCMEQECRESKPSTSTPTSTSSSQLQEPPEAARERLTWAHCMSVDEKQEETEDSDYDVLPPRNTVYPITQTCEEGPNPQGPNREDQDPEENPYDVPLPSREAGYRWMRESVYDVPSSLLRRTTELTVEEQGWGRLTDPQARLGGGSSDRRTTDRGASPPSRFRPSRVRPEHDAVATDGSA